MALLPDRLTQEWRHEDLGGIYAFLVSELSESLSGAARIDAVRLGLFVHGLGTGRPLDLGASPSTDNDES